MSSGGAKSSSSTAATGGMTGTDGTPNRTTNTGGTFGTGASTSAGASPDSGISGASDSGGQSTSISQLPADAVPVCSYAESGPENVITVHRDSARTNYYLVGNRLQGVVVHPIGTVDSRVFLTDIDGIPSCHVLYGQILSGGLMQFVDAANTIDGPCIDEGPSVVFTSTCSQDGVQATQPFKDATLYLLFNRPDGTVYHADIADCWTTGIHVIDFYTAASGSTIGSLAGKSPIGSHIEIVSQNPDDIRSISFVDMDNRLVTVGIGGYPGVLRIQTAQP